eukprot:3668047-Rhodomonas_salina.3
MARPAVEQNHHWTRSRARLQSATSSPSSTAHAILSVGRALPTVSRGTHSAVVHKGCLGLQPILARMMGRRSVAMPRMPRINAEARAREATAITTRRPGLSRRLADTRA